MADIIKLNNQDYIFEGYVYTAESNSGDLQVEKVPLSYQNIGSIEVVDTIFNLDADGMIIFKNQYNIFENTVNFKSNNRSGVFFRISPSDSTSASLATPERVKSLDISNWGVFNKTTSVNSEKSNSTINAIDFISPTVASLKETKASALNGGSLPQPFQISGPLGEYIKQTLSAIRKNSDIKLKIYKDGTLSDDIGGEQTLTYQIPLHYSLNDLLELLLKLYIVNDKGVYTQALLLHRKHDDTYILVPFTSLIGNMATKENNETFIIGSQSGDEPSTDINVIAAKKNSQNVISGYSFSDTLFDISNNYFTDICVVSDESTLNVNVIQYLKVKDVIERLNQNIVSLLQQNGYKNPVINVDLDPTKTGSEATNYKVVSFPYQGINHKATAEAVLVGDILFNNMELQFITLGAPYRRSGVFINIDKDQPENSVERELFKNVDDKVLGQWLVVEIIHKFFEDKYFNVIKCIKPFRETS